MDFEDDDIVYGINAPARNIPELAIATQTLINDIEEQVNEGEISCIIKYLDLYVKENPLPQICFKDGEFEWFNVSRPLTFEELSSHVVVYDFFTYCCINCLHILPDLNALETEYSFNNSPLLIVGVHSAKFDNERLSKCVKDALKKNNILHPVLNDVKCKLWNDLGISCWPTLLISGPHGRPLFVLMGEGKKEFLFKFVAEVISYFKKSSALNPRHLPLEPYVHFPSEGSDLYYPGKVDLFEHGLVISDSGNNRIILTTYDGSVLEVIGSGRRQLNDGCFKEASFNNPQGVAFHSDGFIFVADTDNHAIRKIDLKQRLVATVAGKGVQGTDKIGGLLGKEQMSIKELKVKAVDLGLTGNEIVHHVLQHIHDVIAAVSREDVEIFLSGMSVDKPAKLFAKTATPWQVINSPWDVCLGRSIELQAGEPSNLLLIAMAGLHQIWGFFLTDGYWIKNSFYREGTVIRLAGSGLEENRNTSYPVKAGFAQPSGISICSNSDGDFVVISDSESSSVRQLSCADGAVKKVAGGGIDPTDLFAFGDKDGFPNEARFQHPLGIASFEDRIYVADSYNHKVKMLQKRGKSYFTETILGNGVPGDCDENSDDSNPMLNEPGGLCASPDGGSLFIADTNNFCIKKLDLKKRKISRIRLYFSRSPSTPSLEDDVDSGEYLIIPLPLKKVEVELRLKLILPSHIHLTPDAHQKYSVTCKGNVDSREAGGELKSGTNISVTVDLIEEVEAEVIIISHLYVCSKEGFCTIKEVSTPVKFVRDEKQAIDNFKIDLQIKPFL